jgi:hypothetical protein
MTTTDHPLAARRASLLSALYKEPVFLTETRANPRYARILGLIRRCERRMGKG